MGFINITERGPIPLYLLTKFLLMMIKQGNVKDHTTSIQQEIMFVMY